MFFNSHLYLLIFLPITLIVYLSLVKYGLTQASKVWLVLASLFFYGWSHPAHLYLLLGSILLNFLIWSALLKLDSGFSAGRKTVFFLGIAFNIMPSGVF